MITAFVGKGGVGKTSIASAYALNLSEKSKTLLVSTDFMSSLSYIFTEAVKNLDVMTLSESEVSEMWKSAYGEEVYSIVSEFVDTDRSILDHIATSPGVAEEFIISKITDLDDSDSYKNIVWDTPASSSTMHLLKVEREFYEHLGRDIKFVLRIKSGISKDRAIKIIKSWQDLSARVWNTLQKSRFVLVTTPDELSVLQSAEIESDLETMGLSAQQHICNRFMNNRMSGYRCDINIGEFSGNSREVIEKIRPNLYSL
ncbi:MAG: hypothetical protein LVQ96_03730 [Thermoplasmatales archaeon]|nr:hypothetical protein [Thermoplasmatales archaeon]MCW6170262.1 hypothetical protein [Thermoplasmatales archaeon]